MVSRPLNTLKNYGGPPGIVFMCDMSFNSHCIEIEKCLKHKNTQAHIPIVIRVMISSHVLSLLENSIVYLSDKEGEKSK